MTCTRFVTLAGVLMIRERERDCGSWPRGAPLRDRLWESLYSAELVGNFVDGYGHPAYISVGLPEIFVP